jgi:hypothetical protein
MGARGKPGGQDPQLGGWSARPSAFWHEPGIHNQAQIDGSRLTTDAAGAVDAVALGTAFLANPDLPERFRRGAPLQAPDPATFHCPGPVGDSDDPFLAEAASA